jgi:hypothetical protein
MPPPPPQWSESGQPCFKTWSSRKEYLEIPFLSRANTLSLHYKDESINAIYSETRANVLNIICGKAGDNNSWIWGSHGGDYEDQNLLGCNAL